MSRHRAHGRGPESPLLARCRERSRALHPTSEVATAEPVRPGTAQGARVQTDEQPHVQPVITEAGVGEARRGPLPKAQELCPRALLFGDEV